MPIVVFPKLQGIVGKPSVMVNIIYRCDCIKGYPDSWLNITLGCLCEGVSGKD